MITAQQDIGSIIVKFWLGLAILVSQPIGLEPLRGDESDVEPWPTSYFAVSPGSPTQELVFRSFESVVPLFEVQLENGVVVDQKAWAAIAVAEFEDSDHNIGYCTATLVGPRVVITAAHCFDADGKLLDTAAIELKGKLYGMKCTQHPEYASARYRGRSPRDDADYALCILSSPVSGVSLENIDTGFPPQKGVSITLTGYGCDEIRVDAQNQPVYQLARDVLRIGVDQIALIDYSVLDRSAGSTFLTRADRDDDPIICPGDSGGPAFLINSDGRRVIAVNSTVAWNGTAAEAEFFSSLAPLGHDVFKSFVTDWQSKGPEREICGIDLPFGESGCRGLGARFDIFGDAAYE